MGRGGAKSYDVENAWFSIDHSVLSGMCSTAFLHVSRWGEGRGEEINGDMHFINKVKCDMTLLQLAIACSNVIVTNHKSYS